MSVGGAYAVGATRAGTAPLAILMASPQLENGYTQLANELLEWVARAPLNGSQFRLMMAVVRKTYGFQKKEDRISATQFHEATGLHKQVIARELRDLAQRGYLVSIGDIHHAKSYRIQKDYQRWDGGKVYTDWLTEGRPEVDTDPLTPPDDCIPIGANVYTDPLTEVYTDPLTTKETKETPKEKSAESHDSGVAVAPPPGTLREQFESGYKAAKNKSERIGVAGTFFRRMLGPPDFARIGEMLVLAKSGGALFNAMAEAAKQTITDDPHDYVEAIVRRELSKERGDGHDGAGTGGGARSGPQGQGRRGAPAHPGATGGHRTYRDSDLWGDAAGRKR